MICQNSVDIIYEEAEEMIDIEESERSSESLLIPRDFPKPISSTSISTQTDPCETIETAGPPSLTVTGAEGGTGPVNFKLGPQEDEDNVFLRLTREEEQEMKACLDALVRLMTPRRVTLERGNRRKGWDVVLWRECQHKLPGITQEWNKVS